MQDESESWLDALSLSTSLDDSSSLVGVIRQSSSLSAVFSFGQRANLCKKTAVWFCKKTAVWFLLLFLNTSCCL